MVSIHSRYAVIPSEPTPNGKLYSLCEQIKLRTHAPLLYVYNKPHNAAPPISVQILINSLSKALVIYYPLAGRLGWIHEGDRWELHCNAKGALLLEATCEEPESLNDLGDFVPTNLVSQLTPNVDVEYDVVPIEEMPLLAVQLTRFRCGGFTLGIALCRAAIDGTEAMRFVSTWAKLARGEGRLDTITEIPCHDRTALDSRKAQQHYSHHRHCEFHAPPIWLGDTEAVTEVVVSTMKLTLEQIKKLKNAANARVRYSTFEVVAGHVWRCVSKARCYGNGEQQTRLSTLVNCRNRLKPPLPNGYAGNAAFPTVTSTCTFGELMHKPLGYAVENVRRALERVNGEFISSALGYIDREKDMDLVRYNFHYPAKSVLGRGMYKGNPNLFVVSWMKFSFRDADFGWGEPVYFGPGYMDSEGKAFVMNNVNGDGVVVRGGNSGFRAGLGPGSGRVRALSGRAQKARIENGLNFVCPSPIFFGLFSGRARALTYVFRAARFGLGLLRVRALSGRAKKARIKNGLEFVCPSPVFFRAGSGRPGGLSPFCQL